MVGKSEVIRFSKRKHLENGPKTIGYMSVGLPTVTRCAAGSWLRRVEETPPFAPKIKFPNKIPIAVQDNGPESFRNENLRDSGNPGCSAGDGVKTTRLTNPLEAEQQFTLMPNPTSLRVFVVNDRSEILDSFAEDENWTTRHRVIFCRNSLSGRANGDDSGRRDRPC